MLRLSTGLRNQLLGIISNLVSNGDFTSNTTGWTAVDATLSSASGGQSGNCLKVAESGGANPGKAYQDVTTKVGHKYNLSVYFKKGDADNGKIMIGTTADEDAIWDSGDLADADWTNHTFTFEATATTTRITLQTNDATNGEFSYFDTVVLDCVDAGLKDIFKDCFIEIRTGSQPSSANDAPTGTLLVTFYSDGASAGLEFDDASDGVISKKSTETWSGTAVATGTAGWFRMRLPGDSETQNTTDCRIDGACATSGGELNMSSLSITNGAVQTISTFQITMPAS